MSPNYKKENKQKTLDKLQSQILFKVIGQVEYGVLGLVVKTLDTPIQQINHYTADEYWGN